MCALFLLSSRTHWEKLQARSQLFNTFSAKSSVFFDVQSVGVLDNKTKNHPIVIKEKINTISTYRLPVMLLLCLSFVLLYCWRSGGRHPPHWPPSPSLPFPSHEKRFQLSDWILFLPDLVRSLRAPSIFRLTRRLFIGPIHSKGNLGVWLSCSWRGCAH